MTSDARKRLAERDSHQIHHDPAVVALIVRERRAAAVEALQSAAGAAEWMSYPASSDPKHWAKWLRARAGAVENGTTS